MLTDYRYTHTSGAESICTLSLEVMLFYSLNQPFKNQQEYNLVVYDDSCSFLAITSFLLLLPWSLYVR